MVIPSKGQVISRELFSKVLDEWSQGKNNLLKFGRYIQQKNGLIEPIEWQILEQNKGNILVISKYALDCQQYHTSFMSTTWENCSLRKWLNEEFLHTAFSSEEQKSIISSTVTTNNNSENKKTSGNNITDKVFLLSITEVNKYFYSDSARQCKGTEYCYAQGAWKDNNGNCRWWLRSPGFNSHSAASVYGDGSIHYDGNYVHCDADAVRPVLWLNLADVHDPSIETKESQHKAQESIVEKPNQAMKGEPSARQHPTAPTTQDISSVNDVQKLLQWAQDYPKNAELALKISEEHVRERRRMMRRLGKRLR